MTLQQLKYVVTVAETWHDHKRGKKIIYFPAQPYQRDPRT